MHLPAELIQLILGETLNILPIQEILKLRQLNHAWNDQISSHLPVNGKWEQIPQDPCSWVSATSPWWQAYMRDKLQRHHITPCTFSVFVYETLHCHTTTILSNPQDEKLLRDIIKILRPARTDPLISEIFNADIYRNKMARYKEHRGLCLLYDPGVVNGHTLADSCEDPERNLRVRLIQIAIRSGDTVALETMLAYRMMAGLNHGYHLIYPMEDAAKHANAETIQVFLRHGCLMDFPEYFTGGGVRKNNVLRVAARSGNWDGFQAWLRGSCLSGKYCNQKLSDQAATGLRNALGVRNREFFWDGVALCTKLGLMDAVVDSLNWVIRAGDVELLEGMMRRVHMNLSLSTYKTRRLLYTVVLECRQRRVDIARVLLTHGLDSNVTFARYPPLLINAFRRKDWEMAGLLIDFGADVNQRYHKESALKMAARLGAEELVHKLLDAGAKPAYRHFRSSYRAYRDERVSGNIGRLFGELGWDDEMVSEGLPGYFFVEEVRPKRKTPRPRDIE